jgi:hypothetical protein
MSTQLLQKLSELQTVSSNTYKAVVSPVFGSVLKKNLIRQLLSILIATLVAVWCTPAFAYAAPADCLCCMQTDCCSKEGYLVFLDSCASHGQVSIELCTCSADKNIEYSDGLFILNSPKIEKNDVVIRTAKQLFQNIPDPDSRTALAGNLSHVSTSPLFLSKESFLL